MCSLSHKCQPRFIIIICLTMGFFLPHSPTAVKSLSASAARSGELGAFEAGVACVSEAAAAWRGSVDALFATLDVEDHWEVITQIRRGRHLFVCFFVCLFVCLFVCGCSYSIHFITHFHDSHIATFRAPLSCCFGVRVRSPLPSARLHSHSRPSCLRFSLPSSVSLPVSSLQRRSASYPASTAQRIGSGRPRSHSSLYRCGEQACR